MKKKILLALGGVILTSVLTFVIVSAFGVENVDGVWGEIDTDGAECDAWASMTGTNFPFSTSDPSIQSSGGYLTDENQVRYGRLSPYYCPYTREGFLSQSGFGFDGVDEAVGINIDEPFFLGDFVHYNFPVSVTTGWERFEYVDLTISVPVDCDDNGTTDTTFSFTPTFDFNNTPNTPPCGGDGEPDCTCYYDGRDTAYCPFPEGENSCPGDPGVNVNGCADVVTILNPQTTSFTCGSVDYTVNIYGFVPDGGDGCDPGDYDEANLDTEYITVENKETRACLWAEIDAPTADVAVTKSCTDFDTLNPKYTITVVNNGPGTALSAQIIDTLPNGVSYTGYTSERTVNNSTSEQGTCSVVGQVVTCNLNAPLLENHLATPPYNNSWVVEISVTASIDPGLSYDNTVTVTTSSNDPDTSDNTATATCQPTEVKLKYLKADKVDDAVLITWETLAEMETLGFNLYRSTSKYGEAKLLNTELIATKVPPGSLEGAAYTFEDPTVVYGITYYYWLEEIDFNGNSQLYGPIVPQD